MPQFNLKRGTPVQRFEKERAKQILLWAVTPEYWDSMDTEEHQAFIWAWAAIEKERNAQ